jgi:hypothetical protein
MNIRSLVLSLAAAISMSLSGASQAYLSSANSPGTLAERADAHAAKITDAELFLAEIDKSLEMARDGDYGRLKRGDNERMEDARSEIRTLLEGHGNAMELQPDERIALFNAQEVITGAIRNDDKNRKVCKREPTLGTRLAKAECLTVAQREARKKVSKDFAERSQRNMKFDRTE